MAGLALVKRARVKAAKTRLKKARQALQRARSPRPNVRKPVKTRAKTPAPRKGHSTKHGKAPSPKPVSVAA